MDGVKRSFRGNLSGGHSE